MQHAERLTLAEMREFLAASNTLSFAGAGRRQIYGLVERTLRAQQYLEERLHLPRIDVLVENGSDDVDVSVDDDRFVVQFGRVDGLSEQTGG